MYPRHVQYPRHAYAPQTKDLAAGETMFVRAGRALVAGEELVWNCECTPTLG